MKTLSEMSQTGKDNYYMVSLLEFPTVVRFIETESRIEATRARGGWNGKLFLMGAEFQYQTMRKFWS